jgi:hypothetical protein
VFWRPWARPADNAIVVGSALLLLTLHDFVPIHQQSRLS